MFEELGGMLGAQQPAVPAAPDPQLKSEWDGWMSNPANRAGLMSFGLQLMTGGWGGPGSQVAQALGAGVEAASGTQKMIDAETNRKEAQDRLDANREEDRQLKRDLAAERATERANTKAAGAEERALRRAEMAYNQLLRLDTTYSDKITKLRESKLVADEETSAAIDDEIAKVEKQRADLAKRQAALAPGVPGLGGMGDAGGETSGISAGTAAGGDSATGGNGPVAPTSGAATEGALNPTELLATLPPEKQAAFAKLDPAVQQGVLQRLQAAQVQSAGRGLAGLPGAMQPRGMVPPAVGNQGMTNWLIQKLGVGQ